jgi:hypothetical protein
MWHRIGRELSGAGHCTRGLGGWSALPDHWVQRRSTWWWPSDLRSGAVAVGGEVGGGTQVGAVADLGGGSDEADGHMRLLS